MKFIVEILGWFAQHLGVKLTRAGIVSTFAIGSWVFYLALYAFAMHTIIYLYDAVHTMIVAMTNNNITPDTFWSLMNCIGILPGLVESFPIVANALFVLFTALTYALFINAKDRITTTAVQVAQLT